MNSLMPFKSKSPRSTSPKLAQKRDCEVSQRLANLLQVTQDSLLLYKIKVRLHYQLFIAKLLTVAMLALAFFGNETQTVQYFFVVPCRHSHVGVNDSFATNLQCKFWCKESMKNTYCLFQIKFITEYINVQHVIITQI